jgi:YD repeat-containing protein
VIEAGGGPPSPTAREQLFTIDSAGGHQTQLTSDGLEHFLAHFSPDGAKLLYTKFLSGGYGDPAAVVDVFVLDRASGVETRLTHSGLGVQGIWSPDGTQIAHGGYRNDGITVMNADGSAARLIASPSGAADDQRWGDYLWSSDNWIYFSVAQTLGGCFKVRLDRMRPDGTARTKITDGGPNCTPAGLEQSGEADPGVSPDGKTLFSSRGLPRTVPGHPELTVRHLYEFSSDPYFPGKPETDLSTGPEADCISGVPKVSPHGDAVALFLFCATDPAHAGVTITDPNGSSYRFVAPGFGPDWNPAAGG